MKYVGAQQCFPLWEPPCRHAAPPSSCRKGALHHRWFLPEALKAEEPGLSQEFLRPLDKNKEDILCFLLLIPKMVISHCDHSNIEAGQGQEGSYCIVVSTLRQDTEQAMWLFKPPASHISEDSMSKMTLVARWLSGSFHTVLTLNLKRYLLIVWCLTSSKVVLEEDGQQYWKLRTSWAGKESSRGPQGGHVHYLAF